jgi:hypothetical protein
MAYFKLVSFSPHKVTTRAFAIQRRKNASMFSLQISGLTHFKKLLGSSPAAN